MSVSRETTMHRQASAARKAAKSVKAKSIAGRALPPQLERLAAQAIADGFGPNGHQQGREHHKVKNIAEVLQRLRARSERKAA